MVGGGGWWEGPRVVGGWMMMGGEGEGENPLVGPMAGSGTSISNHRRRVRV